MRRCEARGREARGLVLAMGACLAVLLAGVPGCGSRVQADPAVQLQVATALRSKGESKAASASTAVASTTTGWATLKGVFKFAGAAPPQGTLSAGKDKEVCGEQVPNESLVVDSGSLGISNVVIFARSKMSRVKASDKKGTQKLFDQKKCMFLTHVLAVETKNDTLVVKNSDPIGHNTNLSPPGNEAINPLLPPNGEVSYVFKRQLNAPAEVTCSIHPWMKAYLLARDDPYFAVSGKDGSFEIKDLPAGEEIEFQVWHERAPGGGLEAKSGWSKGRFKLKFAADKTEDLSKIEVPASAFQ